MLVETGVTKQGETFDASVCFLRNFGSIKSQNLIVESVKIKSMELDHVADDHVYSIILKIGAKAAFEITRFG